ncbi:MAPEG family protein [Hyphomicrobium sp.]|uniref:MAPEG family protein n=1 Tax=Hyphomicrobium sp. TaxID=82 RepID=UPI000FBDE2B8|nr:MAPEG family protein [Hyphomicrobium sp.]MBN9248538.1 MAPEG family protein [Hyphomicrobium sp.]RUP09788.1 MAG: MAPEG family protein [Hyphomicrobium sp.]
MTVTDFLLPVFVEVGLTLVLLVMMAMARTRCLTNGEVRPGDIALGEQKWPTKVTQYANAFRNQFELPVLFYVLVAFILITRVGDVLLLVLAWCFVVTRIIHAYIHVTYNTVRHRGAIFGLGAVALIAMWIVFAIKILTGI